MECINVPISTKRRLQILLCSETSAEELSGQRSKNGICIKNQEVINQHFVYIMVVLYLYVLGPMQMHRTQVTSSDGGCYYSFKWVLDFYFTGITLVDTRCKCDLHFPSQHFHQEVSHTFSNDSEVIKQTHWEHICSTWRKDGIETSSNVNDKECISIVLAIHGNFAIQQNITVKNNCLYVRLVWVQLTHVLTEES